MIVKRMVHKMKTRLLIIIGIIVGEKYNEKT